MITKDFLLNQEEFRTKNSRVPSFVFPEENSFDGWQFTDTKYPRGPSKHKFRMVMVIFFPLIGVIVAIVTAWTHGWMGWFYLNMLILGALLTGTGITVGYHRLLTHKSFETYQWIKRIWIVLGALAIQKSPIEWCSVHRRHHSLSDRPGDPHSPNLDSDSRGGFKGFFYSHIGWLFTGYLLYCDHQRYVPDLIADRFIVWIHYYYEVFWIPFSFLLPAVIAGIVTWSWHGFWLGLLWGGLVRVFIVHHITWSINSICHLFGTRDYNTNDYSKNNWLFGILAFGEGWHNNHHAFPSSARQGLKWWQFDLSWLIIRAMQLLGLAWNVRLPRPQVILRKKLK